MKACRASVFGFLAVLLYSSEARAAPTLDGAQMGWGFALPFAGILLSIATGPLLFPQLWQRHYGKIALCWAAVTLLSLVLAFGIEAPSTAFVHIMLADYVSFIVLLVALYTVAGDFEAYAALTSIFLAGFCASIFFGSITLRMPFESRRNSLETV